MDRETRSRADRVDRQSAQPLDARHELCAFGERSIGKCFEDLRPRLPAQSRKKWIEHDPSADGQRRRVATHDKSVAGDRDKRRLESELHESPLPGLQRCVRPVDEPEVSKQLRGKMMKAEAG